MASLGRADDVRLRLPRSSQVRGLRFHPGDWAKVTREARARGMTYTMYVSLMLRAAWDAGLEPEIRPPFSVDAWHVGYKRLDMSGREIGSGNEEKGKEKG